MGPQVDQALSVHNRAAFAVQPFATSAFGGSAKVKDICLFQIAPDLVGGDSQDTGIPYPKAMPVNPIPRSSETIGVELKPSGPRGQLHHQVVWLPAGTPASNLLLEILGIAGSAPSRTNEVKRLKPFRCSLLRETLDPCRGGRMSTSRPLAYPTAATVEDLEEPTEADEDANQEDSELHPSDHGPITSEEEKPEPVQRI
jgi:hypothetical protein